jgi:AcrR family transcriptional regulator
MPKIKQSPKLPALERRQQLLQSARTLFMKKGVRTTSTEEIAHGAGLTKGALYFHFRNKEDILFELVRRMHEESVAAIATMPKRKASPADLLRVLLDARPEAGTADFGSYLDFWIQAFRSPKIRRFHRTYMEEFNKTFAERIDRSYAPTRRDRHDLAMLIIALHDGLAVRKMLDDPDVDFPRQMKLFATLTRDRIDHRNEKQTK